MRLIPVVACIALVAALFTACSSDAGAEKADSTELLAVSDAWLRPGIDPTAIYLDITNAGDRPATISGVEVGWADRITIHETVDDDGLLVMQHLDSVTVAPGETISFEPGGMHLMAQELHGEVAEGDRVTVTLLSDAGSRIEFTAVARVSAETATEHEHGAEAGSHEHAAHGSSSAVDVESHGAVFASGTIPPGKSFEFTFAHAFGSLEVPYHNHLDGSSGTVMVMAGAETADEVEVTINEDGFHPAHITVLPGTKVTWTNTTGVAWTVVNGHHPSHHAP